MTIKEIVKFAFPDIFLNKNIQSIYGECYIRFELGGEELENGTKERVEQVIERATEIYKQTIGNDDVLIIIEEYQSDFYDKKNKHKDYLYSLLNKNMLKRFKGPFEQTYFETDNAGIKKELISEDKLYCDLLIGKMKHSELNSEKIIEGKAKLEMGFKPCISQDIVFFSLLTTNGFRIYDDRGCDVWSSDKEKLRHVYCNLNKWILNYNRQEIDSIFK